MYLTHFGLDQPPFGMTPNPNFFFAGSKRGEILGALIYAVLHGEGIIKVTGEVGSGKTMLCRMLEHQLPDNIDVIYLVNPTLTRGQVVYAIAGELELNTDGKRVDEVIRMLHSDLIAKHIAGRQVVLLVEEAQAMPLQTLEEIRLFSNLETAHHKLLQIVLFGQPELDLHLNLPSMRQLKERITHSFNVPPLTPDIIPRYLMFRLRAAGYRGPDIFSGASIKLIAKVSAGIARRISILADKSLLAAFSDNSYAVLPKHVRAAVEDSQFPRTALITMGKKTAMAACAALLLATGFGWHFFTIGASAATEAATSAPTPATNAPPPSPAIAAVAPAADDQNQEATQPLAATTPTAPPFAPPATSAPASRPAQPVASDAASPSADSTRTALAASADTPDAAEYGANLEQRLHLTDTWLTQQSPDNYSVQITLLSKSGQPEVARILHEIETETGLSGVHVYVARKASSTRFGIVYGSYATRADAVAILHQLSEQWGYRPQLRTIGGIKREIADTSG